ncbi:MAG: cytochrome P460 family protein [Gemmataceae bacterium]|nr:cytochrome P460 family protein [Gemmataceae bacterium]
MSRSIRGWVGGGVAIAGVLAFTLWNVAQPSAVIAADKPADKPVVEFSDDGKMKQPTGYRKWPFVGTPVTPNDMNGGDAPFPEFHIVYMDPDSFVHYEKTGEYRDGTVLVKELTSVGTKEATSGKGYFMGEYIGLEVSMKDAKRFKDEPGNWAYFSFGHKYPLKETATTAATASCNACHQANAKQDYVFTQYYPVLRAAAPKK